jgi:hypothetical protein
MLPKARQGCADVLEVRSSQPNRKQQVSGFPSRDRRFRKATPDFAGSMQSVHAWFLQLNHIIRREAWITWVVYSVPSLQASYFWQENDAFHILMRKQYDRFARHNRLVSNNPLMKIRASRRACFELRKYGLRVFDRGAQAQSVRGRPRSRSGVFSRPFLA